MSSEDIEKMIEEINKSQSGENQEGQSSSNSDNIDLEDFLEQVEEGNADNDFTKNYNNKELKEKIDYQKEEKQDLGMSSGKQDLQSYEVNNVLSAVQNILGINSDEVKRRFPTKKSIVGFISSLSKDEIDSIATNVGIPIEINNIEKQKQISNNLAKEINI